MNRLAVIEHLYKAWTKFPNMSLGRFIDNSIYSPDGTGVDIYFIDDNMLVEKCEEYAECFTRPLKLVEKKI